MTQVARSFRLRAYNGLLSRTSSMRCESADRRCRPQRRERENRCRPVQGQGTPPTQIRASRTSCAGVPNNGLARLCPIIAAIGRNLFANSSPELINPTAIARTYSSTESILGTATQHPWTSSSCLPSPNASPQKPEYDKRPRKDPEAMMHVRHAAQAQTGSATGCGTYSSVEPGVRARSQSFSQSVSVLRRIMLESHQAPMTAQTRRRPIWNQPHDVTSVVRPVALVLR